jgi:hypothetical protein
VNQHFRKLFAFVASALALALCAHAKAQSPLISTVLKRVSISADSKVWKVDKDKIDSDGDPSFSLDHRASDGDYSVTVGELKKILPLPISHAEFWKEFADSSKTVFKTFREVPVPKGLVAPTGYGCNAAETSIDKSEPKNISVFCSASKWSTQALVTVYIPRLAPDKHIGDVNALLATVKWK